ncbi:MAG TPA: zinc ribbon domain-containing protein [Candidatus Limnocylindrales bacterium]
MPTYEYRCSSCGNRLEIIHSIHGGPPETCPSCGARDTLRKAFAPPAIVFKGSGWAKKERSSRPSGARDGESSSKGGDAGSGGEGTKEKKDSAAAGSSGSGGSDSPKTASAGG